MLVKGYWADPFLDRTRTHVFSPTLDSMIDEDDPVRLVDEVLAEIDWSSWEAEYNGHRGQPPSHPRYINHSDTRLARCLLRQLRVYLFHAASLLCAWHCLS